MTTMKGICECGNIVLLTITRGIVGEVICVHCVADVHMETVAYAPEKADSQRTEGSDSAGTEAL